MVVPWVLDEMKTADRKDKRLNSRLRVVLSQVGGHPTASIPMACGGHAEMTAAYRLFDNENATFEAILQPHIDATRHRIGSHPVVLVVQDTWGIEVTRPQQQMAGAGPLDSGAGWGMFLHPLHASAPDGTPLGTVHALTWVRDQTDERWASLSRSQRAATPIEEKESYRWVDALRRTSEEAQRCPSTQLVCVADSEADIYELLAEATTEPHRVYEIVRACQNRALQRGNGQETAEKYVPEVDPPENDVPVEWVWLTSLPVDEIEHVRQVIQYYGVRWMIEVFFQVLKWGGRVEERRFAHIDRWLWCMAVYLDRGLAYAVRVPPGSGRSGGQL